MWSGSRAMGRPRSIDLSGNKYSYLTVIERSENYSKNRKWLCLCICGKTCEVRKQHLLGSTKSCGCMKSELLSSASKLHGKSSNGKNSPEYQSYVAMMHRCCQL